MRAKRWSRLGTLKAELNRNMENYLQERINEPDLKINNTSDFDQFTWLFVVNKVGITDIIYVPDIY